MRRLLLALALLLAATLPGCAEGPQGSGAGDEDAFDDLDATATADTGLIRGIVVDPTIVPVPDATVRVDGLGLETITNEDGAFVFSGLAPGTYFLTTEKPGFQSIQTSASVEAGVDRPPILKVQLVPDPSSLPYVTPFQFDGFIACSVRPMVIGIALCSSVGVFDDTFSARYTLDRVPDWIQSEAVWESTQPLGQEMSLSLTCLSGHTGCPDGQYDYAQDEGTSPRIATVPREVSEEFALGAGEDLNVRMFVFGTSSTDVYDEEMMNDLYNSTVPQPVKDQLGDGCVMWPVYFADCVRATGVGVLTDQAFTVYTNVFYGFNPQEGWAFIENGPHPVPQ